MMKALGSQRRQTLKDAKLILIKMLGNEALTLNEYNEYEIWFMHNDHAGYTLEIDGVGYEFTCTLKKERLYQYLEKFIGKAL